MFKLDVEAMAVDPGISELNNIQGARVKELNRVVRNSSEGGESRLLSALDSEWTNRCGRPRTQPCDEPPSAAVEVGSGGQLGWCLLRRITQRVLFGPHRRIPLIPCLTWASIDEGNLGLGSIVSQPVCLEDRGQKKGERERVGGDKMELAPCLDWQCSASASATQPSKSKASP